MLRRRSIRRKLVQMLLLTSAAAVGLTAVAYCIYEYVSFRRTSIAHLATVGEVIARNSAASLAFQSAQDAEEILAGLQAEPHIDSAALYTPDGAVFARYIATADDDRPLPARLEPDGRYFGRDGIQTFLPVQRDNARLGTLYLHTNLHGLYQQMRLFALVGFCVVTGSFVIAFVLARYFARQIAGPILALEHTARRISEHDDYSQRVHQQADDEVGRLIEAFNDMLTRIQQLNAQLEHRVAERTAELETANQELEAFSYSVSHDLRAPLRHIGGFASMLHAHAAAQLDDKGRRYISVIQDSAKRMGRLIDDLLAFSRHSRAELKREGVPLDPIVAEIREDLRGEENGRKVTWDIAPLPAVRGDAALLRQVFVNLLGNALKYTRKCAETRIAVGVQSATDREAVVYVRDNGAGFDMKYIDKLFGVFQRLHADDAFEGTGVGLATVRRIVQRHGGRVWAEARVNEGATFYVALPTHDPARPNLKP